MGVKSRGNNLIIMVEVMGLREGLKTAIRLGLRDIIIEGDNLCVIILIINEWDIPREIDNVLADAREIFKIFSIMSFITVSGRQIQRQNFYIMWVISVFFFFLKI